MREQAFAAGLGLTEPLFLVVVGLWVLTVFHFFLLRSERLLSLRWEAEDGLQRVVFRFLIVIFLRFWQLHAVYQIVDAVQFISETVLLVTIFRNFLLILFQSLVYLLDFW